MRSFAPLLNSFITSSRNTIPSSGSIPAFDRKRRDVTIVLISHCSMAIAIDSRPAVKFKFTGTFPASDSPRFASAPPTDAGSSNPTFDSFGSRRRAQRDRSIAATSTRPNVSGFVVASAIENDHH